MYVTSICVLLSAPDHSGFVCVSLQVHDPGRVRHLLRTRAQTAPILLHGLVLHQDQQIQHRLWGVLDPVHPMRRCGRYVASQILDLFTGNLAASAPGSRLAIDTVCSNNLKIERL
jgi:hypothetical protein